MTFELRDAVREDTRLLIVLSGGTGSGKTESAMRLATGLAGGRPWAVIDTESGRALHKADDYTFRHGALDEPFTPEAYTEAVKKADEEGNAVIVVDSGSHEWEGIGGVRDLQDAEFERMGRREGARMASWIEPKKRHKRFVQQLLRTRAHVILCLRAEDKIEIVKENGQTVVRPKASLTGAQGWIPICEKRLPFEATISLLVTQENPGVPVPIKLERRHVDLVPLDQVLDEETGKRLAEWAAGGGGNGAVPEHVRLAAELLELADQLGARDATEQSIADNREKAGVNVAAHVTWLKRSLTAARKNLEAKAGAGDVAPAAQSEAEDGSLFQAPAIRPDREAGQ